MKLSIIIPVYNVEKYLRRCLDSVAGQTLFTSEPQVAVECILVDDCGTDASMQIARDYVDAYTGPVQWRFATHTHNRGPSAARNTGLDMATGDYILFVDSDDELLPRALEALLATALRYPKADMVQGDVVVEETRFEPLRLRREELPDFTDQRSWIDDRLYVESPVTAWNKLLCQNFIRRHRLRFKDGLIHEDDHWLLQMRRLLQGVAWCKECTYVYHTNADSIMKQQWLDRHHMSILEIYREFMPEMTAPRMIRFAVLGIASRLADSEHLQDYGGFRARVDELVDAVCDDSRTSPFTRRALKYLRHPRLYKRLLARLRDTELYCTMILIDRARKGLSLADGRTPA
ncbi:MAG: glycosyltransferase family 2 protein [Candidatus Amulumruptor caecigallinarius]|nr:glycosyltransferase family 2 protein [Candidatus Amulumruptor caecigallinarius]MCM1397028.1 glycosyltransferase family 2 protein [Candidatus Amulumruptor caecigallinarius]MCM1454035.1 glycosyltransferase family 2 protein [bacterium]